MNVPSSTHTMRSVTSQGYTAPHHRTSKFTQLRFFFLRSSLSPSAVGTLEPRDDWDRPFRNELGLDFDSSMRASHSVNSSSPGAEAVDDTEASRRTGGRAPMLKGLLKRGDEPRMGCLPAAMEEAAEEECRE